MWAVLSAIQFAIQFALQGALGGGGEIRFGAGARGRARAGCASRWALVRALVRAGMHGEWCGRGGGVDVDV